jgi:hypothetical protein
VPRITWELLATGPGGDAADRKYIPHGVGDRDQDAVAGGRGLRCR